MLNYKVLYLCLSNGLVAIVSFNYGAKNKHNIYQAFKYSCLYSLIFAIIGTILFNLLPIELMKIFNANKQMIDMGIYALRLISFGFIASSIVIMLSSVFQSLHKANNSLILSLLRGILLLLPFSLLFYCLYGINYLWYGFILSESITLIIAIILFYNIKRKLIDKI